MAERREPATRIGMDIGMDELTALYPETIAVLSRNGMLCVGCLLASFHDLRDAAREHGLDADKLYEEILVAVKSENERNTR